MHKFVEFFVVRSNASFLGALVLMAFVLFTHAINPSFYQKTASAIKTSISTQSDFGKQIGFNSKTPLEVARTLEAQYRANPNPKTAKSFAEGLLYAREYRELAELLRSEGDRFVIADHARIILRAETDLRLSNYQGALSGLTALLSDMPDDPEALYIKARVLYGLGESKPEDILNMVAPVVRAGGAISAAAWLLRARIAMDQHDLDYADAAINRAAALGGDPSFIEAFKIEALLRLGRLDEVRVQLDKRQRRLGSRKVGVDVQGERLAAMLELMDGKTVSAATRLDRISFWSKYEIRGSLLRGVAKFESGATQQGHQIFEAHLENSPNDWIANNLYQEYISNEGEDLRETRSLEMAYKSANFDRVVSSLSRLAPDDTDELRALTGRQVVTGYGDNQADEIRQSLDGLVSLAFALRNPENTRTFRRRLVIPPSLDGDFGAPLARYFSGRVQQVTGEMAAAVTSFEQAARLDPHFFAPVQSMASDFVARDRLIAAEDVLASFIRHNPERSDAKIWFAKLLNANGKKDSAQIILGNLSSDELFEDPNVVKFYGELLETESQEFRDLLEKARKRVPSSKVLGALLHKVGDYQASSRAYLLSLAANKADPGARTGYLEAMSALGREKQARKLLNQIDEKAILEEHGLLKMGNVGVDG